MNVEVAILSTSDRGIQVTVGSGAPFWLPYSAPGLTWSATPEVGDVVYVRLPRWLIAKHRQLTEYHYQRSLSLYAPVETDPGKAHGALPMADDNRGALFRIPDSDKKNDKWPDYRGDIMIEGIKWKLAGWIKTDKNGRKYLALAAKPAEEQPERQPSANSYAQATGRGERQQMPPQRPAGGPTFRDDEQIPFGPEWRA